MHSVVKLGGSLARGRDLDALLAMMRALAGEGHRIVVVPGGGVFADAVRGACGRGAVGSTAAHWMAVLAMDQMAYLLVERMARQSFADPPGHEPGFPPVLERTAAGIARALASRRIPILAPFGWVRADDPLPHGWDVTSDSIAAWVAERTGAGRLVLLKSVDGVTNGSGSVVPMIDRAELGAAATVGDGVVDRQFPHALGRIDCWIINGRRPERLRALLEQHSTIGTQVR